MFAKEILKPKHLKAFKQLELLARSVVEGFTTGLHKSPFKGFAIEFAEHRQYVPGDDLKHLDWKVLGKLDRFYVKQYEEDTSMRAYLVLDTSGSMAYKSGEYSKLDYGKFICAVFSYLLLQQGDSVGLVTCDAKVNRYLPARCSLSHLRNMTDALGTVQAGQDTGLGNALHSLATLVKRRALIVIISDFFDRPDEIALALNHFAHKRHEVILYQVLDRNETDFPFRRLTRFDSLENMYAKVMVDPLRYRDEYRRNFEEHQRQIRKICRDLRIDFAQMFTDDVFERSVAGFLAGRLRR